RNTANAEPARRPPSGFPRKRGKGGSFRRLGACPAFPLDALLHQAPGEDRALVGVDVDDAAARIAPHHRVDGLAGLAVFLEDLGDRLDQLLGERLIVAAELPREPPE